MTETWPPGTPGLLRLPSGRAVRGRGLRYGDVAGEVPAYGVCLTGRRPEERAWESVWVPWRDFWLPGDPEAARAVLRGAYERAAVERVEICCGGGVGRTGTALSVLCVFDGLEPREAVRWVRAHYHRRAVEVPWQRRFVRQVHAAEHGGARRG
ncbi:MULTISPECIES: protein phosphatase [unclassified Streptomyces]|uniref:protein-tyrosine phosphatase family protein n=1 Tax=unclassified Streptomyces TaxID=2593676 RepID=UPI00381CE943